MDLWIRSQNKNRLMKIDYLQIIYDKEDKELPYYINASYEHLGAYKTEERALEVLNEIEERISSINALSLVYDTNALISIKNALGEDKIKGLAYPYQMPEE